MIPWTTEETFLLIGLWPKASAAPNLEMVEPLALVDMRKGNATAPR